MSRKKRKKAPVETVINPMNYKRLFAFLRVLTEVPDQNFEPKLGLLLKGLYYEDGGEWFEEGKVCEKAAFLTTGAAYGHYEHSALGKVVHKIFKPGELIINAYSFFKKVPSDFTVTLCPGANLMYITIADLKLLLEDFRQVNDLVINAVSALNLDILERDLLLRLKCKKRIVRFFTTHFDLLKPAWQCPLAYKDLASYLNLTPYNFSRAMKALFPDL